MDEDQFIKEVNKIAGMPDDKRDDYIQKMKGGLTDDQINRLKFMLYIHFYHPELDNPQTDEDVKAVRRLIHCWKMRDQLEEVREKMFRKTHLVIDYTNPDLPKILMSEALLFQNVEKLKQELISRGCEKEEMAELLYEYIRKLESKMGYRE